MITPYQLGYKEAVSRAGILRYSKIIGSKPGSLALNPAAMNRGLNPEAAGSKIPTFQEGKQLASEARVAAQNLVSNQPSSATQTVVRRKDVRRGNEAYKDMSDATRATNTVWKNANPNWRLQSQPSVLKDLDNPNFQKRVQVGGFSGIQATPISTRGINASI